ncbi:FAS1-like dehydratase domain-containing protein [Rhodococcus sp. Leaf7]|uniref:FAS1-like dehydratase domain-containing protein n=2 Tax=unclassified Rhodococcus (in: high G+C Gram-positive bacteria) TaxID=192944 RepID=UPI000A92EFEA|nr:MaoC family dehydratase N-terminal domain-containing protein [Rhodococcus sp. Leaf7]
MTGDIGSMAPDAVQETRPLVPHEVDHRFERTTTLVGHKYVIPDYYEVGREKIRELARAIQNNHPAHHNEAAAADLGYDGLIAPATFVSVVGSIAIDYLFSHILVEYEITAVLQTDQSFVLHRPLLQGDRLVSELQVISVRQFAGNDIIVVQNHITSRGEDACTSTTTFIAQTDADVDPRAAALVSAVLPASTPRIGPTARPEDTDSV